MSKAWIEDLWLTEPRETLPDGSKVKIPVPSSVTKSLAAYMKTPEKAKVPGKFKTARYGHGKRWRVSWWATLPDGSKKGSSKGDKGASRAPAEPMPSRSRQPWRMIFAQVGMLIRPMPTGHSNRSPWNGSHPRTTCAVVAIFDMRTT